MTKAGAKLEAEMQVRRQAIDAGLVACLSTPEGRAFLAWVIYAPEMGRVDQGTFMQDTVGAGAPLHSAFYEGRRSLAALLRDRIVAAHPELHLRLLGEKYAEDRVAAQLAREATKRDQKQQGGNDDDE